MLFNIKGEIPPVKAPFISGVTIYSAMKYVRVRPKDNIFEILAHCS
jgi:hypothetical protein